MTEVKFEFNVDEKVKTIFGEKGIVDMAALDNSGCKIYYIKLKGGSDTWFKEDQLTKN